MPGRPDHALHHSASKFAVRGFSNSLRHELAGSTVGVTVVHPGGIATSIANSARVPAGVSPQEVAMRRKQAEHMLRMPPSANQQAHAQTA